MVNDCLIVPVNGDLDDAHALQLRQEILKNVKRTGTKEVLIDVSTVRVLDGVTFSIFRDTARMISMLGADVVFVGFQAGVASALVDLDIELEDICTAVTVQDGLELLRSKTSVFMDIDEIEETTPESSNGDPDIDERPDT
jgi:rsbT antagonist protein RsbS